MITDCAHQRFRFRLQPKAPLHMPAYNKGNVIRGGFGSAFRRIVDRGIYKAVFVIVFVKKRMHGGAGELRAAERVL